MAQIAQAILSGPLPDVRRWRDDVTPTVVAVLERALARDREARFATAAAFADALLAAARPTRPASGEALAQLARHGTAATRAPATKSDRSPGPGTRPLWRAPTEADSESSAASAEVAPVADLGATPPTVPAVPPGRAAPGIRRAAAGALVVSIALGVALWRAASGDQPGPAAPATTPAAPTSTSIGLPPLPGRAPSRDLVAEQPRAAPPAAHALRVTSTPVGATVVLNGQRLGRTPLVVDLPLHGRGTIQLKLRRRGYLSTRRLIELGSPLPAELAVTLRARR